MEPEQKVDAGEGTFERLLLLDLCFGSTFKVPSGHNDTKHQPEQAANLLFDTFCSPISGNKKHSCPNERLAPLSNWATLGPFNWTTGRASPIPRLPPIAGHKSGSLGSLQYRATSAPLPRILSLSPRAWSWKYCLAHFFIYSKLELLSVGAD